MIGVCSYLLIGYWSHRLSAVKSAQKAILVNRVSDGLLLWGVLWVWWHTGSLEYDLVLLNAAPHISTLLSISILIGAMGKSAQVLFHVWLADAIEGQIKSILICLVILLASFPYFPHLDMCTINVELMFCIPQSIKKNN
jgi:NADH:ubiquinone oxidoreductase subunit 5 (subunit L)/multisubunit Na+/H+ antiporter MnhA subunit